MTNFEFGQTLKFSVENCSLTLKFSGLDSKKLLTFKIAM